MKKVLSLVMALALCAGLANAQEAFKHLGAGVEIGTAGAGIEFSLPLVSDHLFFKAGYNFPSVSIKYGFDFPTKDVNANIAEVNNNLKKIPGCTEQLSLLTDPAKVDASAKLNMSNVKLMFEYYPGKKSSFHITAGLFLGNPAFANIGVTATKLWSEYQVKQQEVASLKTKYPGADIPTLPNSINYNVDGKSYGITDGSAGVDLTIAKVKPYLGVGFGRSIPKTRVGFQGEIGAWYHGKAGIKSVNTSVAYDKDAPEILTDQIKNIVGKAIVYPCVTLRVTVRLF